MASNLNFTVSCVDRATATMNKINTSVSKMTRPWTRLSRSVGQFSRASGFSKLGQTMGRAASEAGQLASKIGKVAAPMTALIGGGTLAGLYEITAGWARLGAETGRTAQILGVSAQNLDAMRNSGRLLGVSADTMTQSFRSFADTLQDARWGRNQGAAAMLQYLGIGLHQTKSGAIDAQSAMVDFADKIQQVQSRDPAAARKLAASFGVEGLLPVLMQGGAAMRAYQAEATRLAGVKTPEMLERASSFALALNQMSLAAEGTKNTIGDKLIPVIQPLLNKWTAWIVANRDLIGQKVAEVVDRIARALADVDLGKMLDGFGKLLHGMIDLAKWVDDVVQKFGGWKVVLIAVAGLMAGAFVASTVASIAQLVLLIGKLTAAAAAYGVLGTAAKAAATAQTLSGAALGLLGKAGAVGAAGAAGYGVGTLINDHVINPLMEKATGEKGATLGGKMYDWTHKKKLQSEDTTKFFEGKGWSRAQSLGISANIAKESSFNDKASGDKGKAYGLGQWHPDRQAQFAKLHGHRMQDGTAEEQLGFYDWELRNSNRGAGDRLRRATTAGESAAIVSTHFERPADRVGEARSRAALAEQMAQSQGNGQASAPAVPSLFARAPGSNGETGDRMAAAGPTAAPQINVKVETKVDRAGAVQTRVTTPEGVKIAYTSPVMAGA
jgi:hypothetical protein